jgi:hypothetical protein
MKKIIILTLIVIFTVLWMARYSIYTTNNISYKLDRFTGSVTFLYGGMEMKVKYVKREKPDLSFLPDKPPKGWGFVPDKPNRSESNE